MARGLDHIVHAVHDLDAAGEAYARLGFTVGARNRHPWGTHNRIVQFPGVFIELLAIGEPELIPPAKPRSVSFGAFTRAFLERGEGLSMLVLEGKGAAADADGVPRGRHRRFRRVRFRARGQAAGRLGREGRVLARVRARQTRARHRLLHLPAALSGEFLESGVPDARERRVGRRGRRVRRREPGRPSCVSQSLLRRVGSAVDLERHHDRDAARRDPGDGPVRVPAALRGRAAGRGARHAARGDPLCGARPGGGAGRARCECRRAAGKLVVAPAAMHGATLVFEVADIETCPLIPA